MSDHPSRPGDDPAPLAAPGASRKGLLMTSALAIALAWCGIGPRGRIDARQEPRPPARPETTAEMVEEQVRLARRALELIDSSRRIGAPVVASSQERYLWSRRLLEAEIFLTLGPDDPKAEDVEVYLALVKGPRNPVRVTAFEGHLERMKSTEQLYRPLFQGGQFSAFNFATVEYNRLQAEVWLSRESRRGEAAPK